MKFKKITGIALVLSLSTGIGVQAATNLPTGQTDNTAGKKIECKHKHFEGKRHFGIFEAAKQMGIEKKDLIEAKKNKKNFFELAKQKGYSEKQAKDIIIKTKTEAINKEVSDGKLTKEEADKIIMNTKEKISLWDGTFKPHKDIIKEKNKED